MEVGVKAPSTRVVHNMAEVSRHSLDCNTQEAAEQAEQTFTTPDNGPKLGSLETNEMTGYSQQETVSSHVGFGEEPRCDDTMVDGDHSTISASKSLRIPKADPSLPARRRMPSAQETYFSMPPPPIRTAVPPPAEARIMHMGSTEFKQKLTFSAIEVLLEEPIVSMRSRQKSHPSHDLTLHSADSSQIQPITKPNARKIRIRSRIILKLLSDIAKTRGHSFTPTAGHIPGIEIPTIFIHPFKLFASLEPDIRGKLAELKIEVEEADDEVADQEKGEHGSLSSEQAPDTCAVCGRKSTSSALMDSKKARRPETDNYEESLSSSSSSLLPPPPPPPPMKREVLQHLQMLIDVFDSDLKPMFDLRRDIKEGTITHISFQDLWHLFEYGQDVRTNDSESQVYRVVRWTGGRLLHSLPPPPPPPGHPQTFIGKTQDYNLNFQVDCVYLDFDGHLYAPGYRRFVIRKYEGEKAILSLPIFPLTFLPDQGEFRTRLRARGDTWLQLTQPGISTHKHYTGLTSDIPQAYEIDSQIIVDAKMAILHCFISPVPTQANLIDHDNAETVEDADIYDPNMSVHQDYAWDMQNEQAFFKDHHSWLTSTTDVKEIEDEDKILLPPHVLGFVLRSRKWARFNVDLIQPVRYTSGFDALVLPDGHKETVRALVATHARTPVMTEKSSIAEHSIDLVRGKGEGLVILLHGAPGVGKTSTAECVADNTQRPLFPITCGDIGDTATDVEKNLESSFQLAHKWGCVLLLDEADIFLQKRDKVDIKRNAIVSVFLRTLEYYRGILFLTTNRVGTFDPAFRSRIHVSLYYPPLKKDATMQIWKMHLRRTQAIKCQDEHVDFRINSKEILQFAKEHYYDLKKHGAGSWNGRQIRNAFQTAIALAEFYAAESHPSKPTNLKIELGKKHFLTVAQASKDFDDYLQRTLGGQNEADMARNEQTRIDDYDVSKVVRRGQGKKKKVVEDVDSEESEGDSEDSDGEEESEDGSEEEVEVVQVVKKVVKKRGR